MKSLDEILFMVFWRLCFGLMVGSFTGALVGAIIRPIRTRYFVSFFSGALLGALYGAVVAVAVNLVAGLLQMAICQRDTKFGWYVPVWVASVNVTVLFIAGAIGGVLAQNLNRAPLKRFGLIVWVNLGGIVGAIMRFPCGDMGMIFSAYFLGALIVFVWCFTIKLIQESEEEIRRQPRP